MTLLITVASRGVAAQRGAKFSLLAAAPSTLTSGALSGSRGHAGRDARGFRRVAARRPTRRPPLVGVLVLLMLLLPGCHAPEAPPPPGYDVVLISLDTVGARHLSLYGYPRPTSPNLERLADQSIVFENAASASPRTAESHMSAFTSTYPSVHGISTPSRSERPQGLELGAQTLAELLRRQGYATVGFHSGGMVSPEFGFGRGFEVYEESRQGAKRSDETSFETAREWLRKRRRDRHFFLFVHTYWAHDPYTPRDPFDTLFTSPDYSGRILSSEAELAARAGNVWWDQHDLYWSLTDRSDPRDVAQLIGLYDGLVAELDQRLGALIDAVDRYAPQAIVVVMGDHGEEFGEHGRFDHGQLYQEVIHVPLLIRHPDRGRAVRVDATVSLVDLAPTLLELLSMPPIEQFQGRSMLALIDAAPGRMLPQFSEHPKSGLQAIRDGDLKLLVDHDGREALYDLSADPGEQHDRIDDPALAEQRERLRNLLRGRVAANDVALRRAPRNRHLGPVSEETLRQLQALGYLGASD